MKIDSKFLKTHGKPGQVLSANYTDWLKSNVDKVEKTRNDFVRFRQEKKKLDVRLKLASELGRVFSLGRVKMVERRTKRMRMRMSLVTLLHREYQFCFV